MDMNIGGIKCDNPECDFRDDSVELGEYSLWLNRPCPKCGANLLTQADYEAVNRLLWIAAQTGINVTKDKPMEGEFIVSVEMNGTGNMKFVPGRHKNP
jgi:hypothetical protein